METHPHVIGFDATTGKMFVDRTKSGNTAFHPAFASIEDAPVTLDKNGNITMRIYLDRSSVEVFAQNGLGRSPTRCSPTPEPTKWPSSPKVGPPSSNHSA